MGSPTMNLHAPKGAKVVLALLEHHGSDNDRKHALKHLVQGGTYTVEKTRVGGASSEVWLQEVPSVSFNSLLFLNAPAERPPAPKYRGSNMGIYRDWPD